jgi:glycosyltransferase involved in cell wall biosynthesis
MISTLNIINLIFPRDTKRRAAFRKLYYAIHSLLPRLSYSSKDCLAALGKLAKNLGENKSGIVVIFDHKLGGGSNIYRDETAKSLMDSGKDVVMIIYNYKDKCYIVRFNGRQKSVIMNKQAGFLFDFLRTVNISEIIINDLVSFPEPEKLMELVIGLKKTGKPKLRLPLHDYYMICPSYNLLDNHYKYCGLPEIDVCENCLQSNQLEEMLHMPVSIKDWRSAWEQVLKAADEIIVFSQSSVDLLTKAYPFIDKTQIKLIPHKVKYIKEVKQVKSTGKIKIGIPGNINLSKGSFVIKQMLDYLELNKIRGIEIIVIGDLLDIYSKSRHLTITGKYRRENLSRIIESRGIDIIFIPSIWPETFSFTTEEAIMTGLPVAAFNLGAPAERLRKYNKSLIIDTIDGRESVKQILFYFNK